MEKEKISSGQRDSRFELLRILAMLLIIFHHFATHGQFYFSDRYALPRFWYSFIFIGGKIGVDVFVLISGYFLIQKDSMRIDRIKVIRLWSQAAFYSIGLYIITCLAGADTFHWMGWVHACLPITYQCWWFASTYFVLFLLHPYLNTLLHGLNQTQYRHLLLLQLGCWCIVPTLTDKSFEGNDLLWFIILYSLAGYIRTYGICRTLRSRHWFAGFFGFTAVTYATCVAATLIGKTHSAFAYQAMYFYGQNKITILLVSVCLFMAFDSMKMNYHKWINVLGSAVFGVYLIHDHAAVRSFLWIKLFRNASFWDSNFIVPYSVFAVFTVYIICTILELLRQKYFEQPYMRIVRARLGQKGSQDS